MIYVLGFRDVAGSDLNSPTIATRCREAVEQACGASGFSAYACWSHPDGHAFYALVGGDADIAQLQSGIADRSEAAHSMLLGEHQPDDTVAALAGEPRAQAMIELAVQSPGAVCGRCNATILPHYTWCEYRIEGGVTDPDPRAAGGGARGGGEATPFGLAPAGQDQGELAPG